MTHSIDDHSEVLDLDALARYLQLNIATLRTRRSRNPQLVPPPFSTRPLRWRRSTVNRWIDAQESAEAARIAHATHYRID